MSLSFAASLTSLALSLRRRLANGIEECVVSEIPAHFAGVWTSGDIDQPDCADWLVHRLSNIKRNSRGIHSDGAKYGVCVSAVGWIANNHGHKVFTL